MQKDVNLFGLPIIRVKKTELCEKRYFLGIQYKVKNHPRYANFVEAFADNVHGVYNRKIKVILNNLGEAVVYARTHALWYKPEELVFGNRPQHIDIFRMFAPHIPVFYCGGGALKGAQNCGSNWIEPLLASSQLIALNNQGKPFLQSWAEHLHADVSPLSYSHAVIPPEVERSALIKARALRLNLDNFVFLSPVARSCDPLSSSFWSNLETSLRSKGYGVLHNSTIFSIPEVYSLASRAKAIIALRSGLCDILCELPVPQFIIYSHNKLHNDLQPMYSFEHFPWATKELIREYQALERTEVTIMEDITTKIYERHIWQTVEYR